jgi:AraC-like DNA-binding protein
MPIAGPAPAGAVCTLSWKTVASICWVIMVRLLHGRFADKLTLDQVATAVSVHPSHLARAFRQYFRCTLGDYVRRLRVDYVCRQLATNDRALGLLALEAGFSDQSHLTHAVKQQTGMTPAQYRSVSRPRKSVSLG